MRVKIKSFVVQKRYKITTMKYKYRVLILFTNSWQSFTACDKLYAAEKKKKTFKSQYHVTRPISSIIYNPFPRERTRDHGIQSECITRTKVQDFAVIGLGLRRDVIVMWSVRPQCHAPLLAWHHVWICSCTQLSLRNTSCVGGQARRDSAFCLFFFCLCFFLFVCLFLCVSVCSIPPLSGRLANC